MFILDSVAFSSLFIQYHCPPGKQMPPFWSHEKLFSHFGGALRRRSAPLHKLYRRNEYSERFQSLSIESRNCMLTDFPPNKSCSLQALWDLRSLQYEYTSSRDTLYGNLEDVLPLQLEEHRF